MISAIKAAQRLDSRGNPTVQVDVTTEKGHPTGTFRAMVPSGASKGTYEAVELRDGNGSVYNGQGVEKAVQHVEHVLASALIKMRFNVATDLGNIDALMRELDGSSDKGVLGANAILGVSMACARAGAAAQEVPLYEFLRRESGLPAKPYILPVPFFNVLNGGMHSGNAMAFQEFMIAPTGADSMAHAVQMGAEVYHELKEVLTEKFGGSANSIGDEGGFAPPITHPHEALDLLVTAIANCGYTGKINIGIDPASSEFFNSGKGVYNLAFKSQDANTDANEVYSSDQLAALYNELIAKYPIILLEDPFAQDDWAAWTAFSKTCKIELVGDDLLATNMSRIKQADEKKACNSLLLKINQIGTVSESLAAAHLAHTLNWNVFVSHRSGETTDDFIADLTVALGMGHLKAGSPARGERVAKYNRLMDIEDELKRSGREGEFAGVGFGVVR